MKSPMWVAATALALAIACVLLAVASGFGHWMQLWDYAAGFKILTGAVVGGVAATALALTGGVLAWLRGLGTALYMSLIALGLALVTVLPPLGWVHAARRLPHIHDISTDTDNPPAFVAILRERANAPNTAEYGGADVARLQHEAYPDIAPLLLRVAAPDAFNAALDAARALGWVIVDRNAAAGRIEASDRTFWYGFVDDVVVRITPLAGGEARVDVRSVSRVGESDVGANARRIRNFQKELSQRARPADAR